MTTQSTTERVLPAVLAGVVDRRLELPDRRLVAWSESGVIDGRPVLRFPGTPGSRLALRADRSPWEERRLRVITTERPGFGASTPLPGRRFAEHADDVAAILDHLGIDRVPVYGGSGAAPHLLAFAARHPERVMAATVMVGAAPLEADEVDAMIDLNVVGHRLAHDGDRDGLVKLLADARTTILADPIGGFRGIMATAPESDQAVMRDPTWQEAFSVGIVDALAQGVEGWADETMAIELAWDDIDLRRVGCSVTWWHGDGDRNAPLSAARRLVAHLPNATLHVWEDAAHLTAYRNEPAILDELLARS